MAQPKTHNDFVEHVVETMGGFGAVAAKQMFGGWGLYHDGAFFAIIVGDALYLKVDDDNRAEFEAAGLESFVYVTKDGDRMAMSYYQAPPEALESPAAMTDWARSGYAAALRAKARKPARRQK
jgi:DNA transformation protein